MAVTNRTKTTLPAISKVRVSDPNLQRFCDSVMQFCAIHAGNVGSGLDRAITAREMVNSGFANWKQTRPNQPGGGSGGNIKPIPPEIPDVVDPPTKPKGFKVISGTVAILLVWDDVDFRGAGSTEIWRHSKPEFSTATKIVTTPAAVYSDIPDGDDVYYYWVRHTNENGDKGPISDMGSGQAGLLTTNPDGDTMLVSDLVAYAIYATNLTAVHIKGGDMDFAGGRFTVDVNGNCTASSLTINSGGYERSSNYSASLKGWAIYGNGNVEFNEGVFRGDVYGKNFYGENGYFKGTVYAEHLVGDIVTAKRKTNENVSLNKVGVKKFSSVDVSTGRPYNRTLTIQLMMSAQALSSGVTPPPASISGSMRVVFNGETFETNKISSIKGYGDSDPSPSISMVTISVPVPANFTGTADIYLRCIDYTGGNVTLMAPSTNNIWTPTLFRDGGDLS
ncbi:hypothetical protein DMW20_11775 [Vibrio parahaemolyticus]|nr:hypothetical protein [Vibrio parahaemolyticus]